MRAAIAQFCLVTVCGAWWPLAAEADAIPVELRQTEEGWQLLRGGEPYFIRGAGGDGSLELLAAAGANSVRTWGADDIDARLDAAHALGLSVTVGIWLGHERHGFDYDDEEQVREQLERARQTVLRYKDHPAVLLWGIGNEMEGFGATKPYVLTELGPLGAWEISKTDWGAPIEPTSTEKATFYRRSYEKGVADQRLSPSERTRSTGVSRWKRRRPGMVCFFPTALRSRRSTS